MKIGLTGSIACGKSTVSSYLRTLGYTVVDADAISHSLTAPGGAALPHLRSVFGDDIFDGDILSRQRLGSLVFSDPAALNQLNRILHPMIIDRIREALDAADAPGTLVFGDVPLLYECRMESMFDRGWVLHVPREVQIARLYARDGLSEAEAVKRIDAQMPLETKCRLADAVISTNGSIENTQRQICALLTLALSRRPE